MFFLPDQHLGRNTAVLKLGLTLDDCVVWNPLLPNGGLTVEQLRDARMILWKGHCSVHGRFSPDVVDDLRATIPDVQILVHPECQHEVVLKADLVGSTEFIIKTIEAAPAGSSWAIGTELNLVKRLADAHPDKQITFLDRTVCYCSTMNRIDLPHFVWAMESLVAGTVVNQIEVDPETERQAQVALQRMLDLPGKSAQGLADQRLRPAARTRRPCRRRGPRLRPIRPPCASTIRRQAVSPMPMPGTDLSSRTSGSKTRSRSSSGTPRPSSTTSIRQESPTRAAATDTTDGSPGRANWAALVSRFPSSIRSWAGSAGTVGRSPPGIDGSSSATTSPRSTGSGTRSVPAAGVGDERVDHAARRSVARLGAVEQRDEHGALALEGSCLLARHLHGHGDGGQGVLEVVAHLPGEGGELVG